MCACVCAGSEKEGGHICLCMRVFTPQTPQLVTSLFLTPYQLNDALMLLSHANNVWKAFKVFSTAYVMLACVPRFCNKN